MAVEGSRIKKKNKHCFKVSVILHTTYTGGNFNYTSALTFKQIDYLQF